jgi:hypothetical protein
VRRRVLERVAGRDDGAAGHGIARVEQVDGPEKFALTSSAADAVAPATTVDDARWNT